MINQLESGVSLSRLCQIEATTQSILEHEPDDTATRLRLAWCLLGQAFHRAGENARSRGASDGTDDTTQLLRRCLHHVTIVSQVSVRDQERQQADTLCSLVEMAGGLPALQESSDEGETILKDILHSIQTSQQPRHLRAGHLRIPGKRFKVK